MDLILFEIGKINKKLIEYGQIFENHDLQFESANKTFADINLKLNMMWSKQLEMDKNIKIILDRLTANTDNISRHKKILANTINYPGLM